MKTAENNTQSEEKFRIYLDHNIYDFHLKNPKCELVSSLADEFKIVYSIENLKEIARSPGYEESYLQLLKENNAEYMEIVLDENFRITDRAMWYNVNPFEIFEEQMENINEVNIPEIDQLYYKFMGGLEGVSFESIINDKFESINALLDSVKSGEPEIDHYIDILKDNGKKQGEELVSCLKSNMPLNVQDDTKAAFRKETNCSPVTLNNVTGQNILKKIWEKISSIFGNAKTIDEALGYENKERMALINPNNCLYQKVCGIYSFLEMAGYWSDRRLTLERRFKSFISDQFHVANAIFTKGILTRDKGMAMKAGAIYEYYGITTKVFSISFQDGEKIP